MSVSNSSVQQTLHHGKYYGYLLSIGNNKYLTVILSKCLLYFHPLHFTPITSNCHELVIPYLITSSMTPDFPQSSKMHSEPSMAHIFMHTPLLLIEMLCVITTACSQPMLLQYVTLTSDFFKYRVAGKGL